MQCPKCTHEQVDGRIDCARCGIVFAKFAARQSLQANLAPQAHRAEQTDSDPVHYDEEPPLPWWSSAVQPPAGDWLEMTGRTLLFVLFTWWGIRYCWQDLHQLGWEPGFWHNVNLPFHEAGHVVFRPFGHFMMSLGGTLGQLLMPIIAGLTMLLQYHNAFGASICLWWLGQNFLDIAPYVNDARAGDLPLLGGNTGHSAPYGFHDWEYLLTESGLLEYDSGIALASLWLGRILILLSLAWGGWLLWQGWRRLK